MDETQEVRDQAAGQAYCLRAWAYFMITRLWKDDSPGDHQRGRREYAKTPTADVYNLIVEDLKKAEVMLPDTWPDGSREDGCGGNKRNCKIGAGISLSPYGRLSC